MVLGLFTGLAAPGGIQRAGRHVASVLEEFAARREWPCRLLSLNDAAGEGVAELGGRQLRFTGFARAKLRFAQRALALARGEARLIVAGHPNLAPVAAAARLTASRARTIVLSHGVEVWQALAPLRRSALVRADVVCAPSRDTARRLHDVQGVPPAKIRVLPWALDPEFAGAAAEPDERTASRVILTVARLDTADAYKGVDVLIGAVARLREAVPGILLEIAGDGDDRPRLEELARRIGAGDSVAFLGTLERAALLDCYRRCDIFALPSGGEGFGLVFLEAMAFGKPVVGGLDGGTPDVVSDGETGLLVPHGDVARLADALSRLLHDPRLRQQMGRRGRERVEKYFLFERFRSRWNELLDSLCAS
jgi:glycosyltransferase involved in cell wall biosynthesis